ncbi:MAG: hypothetical protein KAJ28_11110 [Flavobacteriaceae bacterium]|nr:hypothetical protein [Flavobacteriaceae bacterium]
MSFRGSYRLEESPYNNTDFYGDLKGFSLGLDYNFGNTKLDLAYENSKRTIDHQLCLKYHSNKISDVITFTNL